MPTPADKAFSLITGYVFTEKYTIKTSGLQDFFSEDASAVAVSFDREKTTEKPFEGAVASDKEHLKKHLDDSGTEEYPSEQTVQSACASEAAIVPAFDEPQGLASAQLQTLSVLEAALRKAGLNPIAGTEASLEMPLPGKSPRTEGSTSTRATSVYNETATLSDVSLEHSISAAPADKHLQLSNTIKNGDSTFSKISEICLPGAEAQFRPLSSQSSTINLVSDSNSQPTRRLSDDLTSFENDDPAHCSSENTFQSTDDLENHEVADSLVEIRNIRISVEKNVECGATSEENVSINSTETVPNSSNTSVDLEIERHCEQPSILSMCESKDLCGVSCLRPISEDKIFISASTSEHKSDIEVAAPEHMPDPLEAPDSTGTQFSATDNLDKSSGVYLTTAMQDMSVSTAEKDTEIRSSQSRGTDDKVAPKGDFVVAINSGGSGLLETCYGISFIEDSFFSGGDVLRTCEIISETEEPFLYQTARYGNVAYTLSDLSIRDYFVDLHFAEIIFTNGPPGMRVFDIFLQGNKVVSELDVYGRVGSNKPLVLSNLRATVKDGTLKIRLEGVVGSPMINGICVRTAPPLGIREQLHNPEEEENSGDEHIKQCLDDVFETEKGVQTVLETRDRGQQIHNKAQKAVVCYELKVDELRNECHQAWISVQESNRQAEKLRDELAFKSITVDTLANAIEGQMNEVRELKEKRERERKAWSSSILKLWHTLQIMKMDHALLVNEAKEYVGSLPDITGMTTSVQALIDENKELKRKYQVEFQERRQLYNKMIDLKGNVRVFCRCRPLSAAEATAGATAITEFDSAKNDELVIHNSNISKKLFKFDRVFTPYDDQAEVFAETAPVVISVLDGYNVCIFAYGQTGTGKTFTMEGTPSNRGVNYRTLQELFSIVDQRKGQVNYEISVSVLEVYNEQIRDLLNTSAQSGAPLKKLEIKQVAEGGLHVPGLVEAEVHNINQVWDVLQSGSSSRAIGSTNANEHSSRSHCMLCVKVKGENIMTGECTRSKLWLVDLAGSERVAKSDVHGERLKEAQNINKSLAALGDVIHALTTKSSHIPYRNSKLTHLLQDSLGGESKTLMFLQISPNETDMGETLCSLNFASRVRGVELGPARKQLDPSELIKFKQLAEKASKDGKSKDDIIKKLEENLRGCESKLKMKEQLCQTLVDKVRDRDKMTADLEVQLESQKNARTAAEAALKQMKSYSDIKVSSKEMSDIRADAEEALEKALRTAASVHAKDKDASQKPPLQEKLLDHNNARLLVKHESRTPFIESKGHNENADPQQGGLIGAPFSKKASSGKAKSGQVRYNSPPLLKNIPRRTGRASTCGVIRRTSLVPPSSLAFKPYSVEGAPDTVLQNGIGFYKDHSIQAKKHQKTDCVQKADHPVQDIPPVQSVVFSATPVTWKGSHLPGGLSRVRPRRRVQFRSPLLRSRESTKDLKLKKELSPPLVDTGSKLSGLETVTSIMRRVSISTSKPWSRRHSSVIGVGGAQRVLSGNRQASKGFLHQKERGWNKC
ncbi:hypothetical protein O6H91_04G119000 [Diphasiastrum complanatum]|uniref:Uncharacterized protein n=1 Tax=Diphasiastrum complanatum TaxID=34168 RepID=A0ACC2E159_DIPCM|nr:hypothetical protein O6H91_04G119000 [Diphasiastrum complanatum]